MLKFRQKHLGMVSSTWTEVEETHEDGFKRRRHKEAGSVGETRKEALGS